MRVPFGAKVVTSDHKDAGKVKRLVLHPESREIDGIVVHVGVLHQRDFIVPLAHVSVSDDTVVLKKSAAELSDYPIYNPEHFIKMPQDWEMPATFDNRDFFLVGGDGYLESLLPMQVVTPEVSGTPRYVRDEYDDLQDPSEPAIKEGMDVYSSDGHKVGDVSGVSVDTDTGRVTAVTVKHGFLFSKEEVTIPASMIARVGKTIDLNATAEQVKALEGKS